jgi:hypothetical protein
MTNYLPIPQPELAPALALWLIGNRTWDTRPDDGAADGNDWCWVPAQRWATVDEVAGEIIQDPLLRGALAGLTAPLPAAIEDAVARQVLGPWQAQILVPALQKSARFVIDQNRPLWQREKVLEGAAVVGFVALCIWALGRS